jgi:hypothetical protein
VDTHDIHEVLEDINSLIQKNEKNSEIGIIFSKEKRELEAEVLELTENIRMTVTGIKDNQDKIHFLENEIIELKKKLECNRKLKNGLEDELSELNKNKNKKSQEIIEREKEINEIRTVREMINSEIDGNKDRISNIIINTRRSKNPGPEKEIRMDNDKIKTRTNGICSLGDIHGWAPGLFNYLIKNDIADISFNNIDWKTFHDESHFKWRPTNFSYRSPPGLDGNPFRPNSPPNLFNNIDVKPRNNSKKRRLILIGDLIDRGDHSELVVEAIRQLIVREPGCCFSLIGNHEGMVILNNYLQWVDNEKIYFNDSGIKDRPYTVSHDPLVTGEDSWEKGTRLNFQAIRSSIGALLLSQHFSLLNSMNTEDREKLEKIVKPTWKKLGLKPKKVKKNIDKGGWILYEEGAKFLDLIDKKASQKEAIIIPGALVSWYQDKSFFLHAEPNGIDDLERNINDKIIGIGGMIDSWNIGGSNVNFQLASIKKGDDGKTYICQGKDGGLLWARGKNRQLDVLNGIKKIKKIFPELENVVHGHTAQTSVISINITTPNGEVCVNNIDESIGPNPRFNAKLIQEYDINIIPEGWLN